MHRETSNEVMMKTLGVIGGSGMYDMDGLKDMKAMRITTPFGDPSDEFMCGTYHDTKVFFLSRHGKHHKILPSEINYRANIYAFKQLNVDKIISVSAVGSMKEDIPPGMLVLPDQFIDKTYKREGTFYGEGIAGHVSLAHPICRDLQNLLWESCSAANVEAKKDGTYLCMEGPQFSTKAESLLYRQWGISVIGMTNMPEAKLAREAGISYATLALATDYDCWHEAGAPVTLEEVLKVMRENISKAKNVLREVFQRVDSKPSAFKGAFRKSAVTPLDQVPPNTLEKIKLLLDE